MGEARLDARTVLFGAAAALLISVVLAFGLFSFWVLFQYGSQSIEFEWQAQRLGDDWYVAHITPGGAADGALRNGDTIVAINGEPARQAASLGLMMRAIAGHSLYSVRVNRAGVQSDIWLRARVEARQSHFQERFPLMAASLAFFLAGVAMLRRWDSVPSRIGFIAASAWSLHMGAWAMLPLASFFAPVEMNAYFLFWLPAGLAIPATLHALLRFSDSAAPSGLWWATCSALYFFWTVAGPLLTRVGEIPAPVPEGVAYVSWNHVAYAAGTPAYSIGIPLMMFVSLAACAIRLLQLLHYHPEGDLHRRLLWLVTGGVAFGLPTIFCEAAKWAGLEYNLASSWLSSLSAICAAYALATDYVTTPALVARGIAGAILPSFLFVRLDRRHFPSLFAAEQGLRSALAKARLLTMGEDWRAEIGGAVRSALSPVTFEVSPELGAGQLFLIGAKSSGEAITRRERALIARIERTILSVLKGKPSTTAAAAEPPRQSMNLLRECPCCGTCYDSDIVRCPADGQLPVLTLPVERVVDGKYKLERLVGRGGMGSVYAARDLRLDRRVAVKLMLSELFGHDAALKRFEREARVAARLSHANIVPIFDFGPVGTMGAYQVMELVEGRSWRSEIDSNGLPPQTILPWVEQLLDGMQAAHEAGIIHRDLKPDNLLLIDREGAPPLVKILDFGLAKMTILDLSREERLSLGVTSIGTVGYVPPEQLTGGLADQRSDIYAIGRILIETLTGSLPTSGEPDLPPHLRDILLRCTAYNPDDRPPGIPSLRAELVPALSFSPAEATTGY